MEESPERDFQYGVPKSRPSFSAFEKRMLLKINKEMNSGTMDLYLKKCGPFNDQIRLSRQVERGISYEFDVLKVKKRLEVLDTVFALSLLFGEKIPATATLDYYQLLVLENMGAMISGTGLGIWKRADEGSRHEFGHLLRNIIQDNTAGIDVVKESDFNWLTVKTLETEVLDAIGGVKPSLVVEAVWIFDKWNGYLEKNDRESIEVNPKLLRDFISLHANYQISDLTFVVIAKILQCVVPQIVEGDQTK